MEFIICHPKNSHGMQKSRRTLLDYIADFEKKQFFFVGKSNV